MKAAGLSQDIISGWELPYDGNVSPNDLSFTYVQAQDIVIGTFRNKGACVIATVPVVIIWLSFVDDVAPTVENDDLIIGEFIGP